MSPFDLRGDVVPRTLRKSEPGFPIRTPPTNHRARRHREKKAVHAPCGPVRLERLSRLFQLKFTGHKHRVRYLEASCEGKPMKGRESSGPTMLRCVFVGSPNRF